LKTIPVSTRLSINLIKSYFNLYNKSLEKKINNKNILLKRLSLNKIFISNGEFKHTNNKIIITLYIFNRQSYNYVFKLKKEYLKSFRYFDKKLNLLFETYKFKSLAFFFRIFSDKNTLSILNRYIKNYNFSHYFSEFYKNLLKNSLIELRKYFYYKQLIFINKSKYNYTYLQYIKKHLESIYNKNIEFNLINLKRFFLNSNILSTVISMKLTKNRRKMTKYLKDIEKKIIIKKNLVNNNPIYNKRKKQIFKNERHLRFFIFNNLKHKHITGYKLELKGRLSKRFTADRSTFTYINKGTLINTDSSYKGLSSIMLKGNFKPNLEYTRLKSKTKVGSFGIKG